MAGRRVWLLLSFTCTWISMMHTVYGELKCLPKTWPIAQECESEQVEYECSDFDFKEDCAAKGCCKWENSREVHWDHLKAYQNGALRWLRENAMQYTGHRATRQADTWVKHDAQYRMSVLPLRETAIAGVTAARYQTGGQLSKFGVKKAQGLADMAQSVVECGKDRGDDIKSDDGVSRCDARVQVPTGRTTQKQYPYSRVGAVLARYLSEATGKYYFEPCSGTIVGAKWVLTAAHCITDKHGYIFAVKDMRFYAHLNEDLGSKYSSNLAPPKLDTDSVTYKVSAVFLPYAFIGERARLRGGAVAAVDYEASADYDIALLELASNVNTGYLGFESAADDTIRGWIDAAAPGRNNKLITIGYPGDAQGYRSRAAINPMGHQFAMHQSMVLGRAGDPEFTDIHPKRFVDHKYKAYPGQSGSSIFHWYPGAPGTARDSHKGYVSIAVASSVDPTGYRFAKSRWCRITALKAAVMNFIINGGTTICTGTTAYGTAPPQVIDYDGEYARMAYDNLLNENLIDSLYDAQQELRDDERRLRKLQLKKRHVRSRYRSIAG